MSSNVKATWWRLDEKQNALDYLEKSVRSLLETEQELWAWKWVCIALHGALYSFGICALQGTNFELVLKNNTAFSWDKIPGEDNEKLIEFLIKRYYICWAQTAEIEKIEDGKVIKVSAGKNSLSLKLNNKESEATVEIDGKRKPKNSQQR